MLIVCGMCGEWFDAKHHRRMYCSKKCQNAAKRKCLNEYLAREKRKKALNSKAAGKSISEVLAYAEDARKRLGRYVSYGEAVMMMEGRVDVRG